MALQESSWGNTQVNQKTLLLQRFSNNYNRRLIFMFSSKPTYGKSEIFFIKVMRFQNVSVYNRLL